MARRYRPPGRPRARVAGRPLAGGGGHSQRWPEEGRRKPTTAPHRAVPRVAPAPARRWAGRAHRPPAFGRGRDDGPRPHARRVLGAGRANVGEMSTDGPAAAPRTLAEDLRA